MVATGAARRGRRRSENSSVGYESTERAATASEERDGYEAPSLPAVPDVAVPRDDVALLRYEDIPPQLGDALRGIINRYELRTGEKLPKSIAVTSPMPGEGVTTVSQALATMIAQEVGRFVCWVDCAWLAGDVEQNGQSNRPNLIDILADQSRILSAFRTSPDLPQLMTLSPGPVPEAKRNVIVRSPEFERLLSILAEEFDHVVFDIPPVLATANGLALLRQADASLLVVRHRATMLQQVKRALELTQPVPNLAVVLNRYRTRVPSVFRRLLES